MYTSKLVFAQVMEFSPWHTFGRLVAKYRADFNVRAFSCLDQFLSMAIAQITFRESLRDIEAGLKAHATKAYHLELRGNLTRNKPLMACKQHWKSARVLPMFRAHPHWRSVPGFPGGCAP